MCCPRERCKDVLTLSEVPAHLVSKHRMVKANSFDDVLVQPFIIQENGVWFVPEVAEVDHVYRAWVRA